MYYIISFLYIMFVFVITILFHLILYSLYVIFMFNISWKKYKIFYYKSCWDDNEYKKTIENENFLETIKRWLKNKYY